LGNRVFGVQVQWVKFVFFADTHLDHSTNGKRNSATGYPQRVIDILDNVKMVVNFAIDREVDFLLFGGDAYKTNKPLEEYRVMFRKEILRAADAGIRCVLIPGNHDMTRRFTAEHSLAEFRHYENVYVIDEPELIDFGSVGIYGLPWQYSFQEGDLELDKFTICIAHCTVLGAFFQSGNTAESNLGKDFGVNLDFFNQFDVTCLGHIHRPQVLNESPFVGYPGSSEWLTWGELGDEHGFYYYDGTIHHIKYHHRPRIKLTWPLPGDFTLDPEAAYEVTVKEDEVGLVVNQFKDAFELKTIVIRNHKKINREITIEDNVTKEALLQDYLGAAWNDVESLWWEIKQEVG
jgi:DNA repair exonuclease SbcCD nuclease subunit